MISSSSDETIKIWDLETGECLETLKEHTRSVTCILLDEKTNKFISGSADNTIKIWNLNNYQCLETLKNHAPVQCLLFLSNDLLACGLRDGTINIWNLQEIKIVRSNFGRRKETILCLTNDYLGRLISGSSDKTINIWNSNSNSIELLKVLNGHENHVLCLKTINDGHFLLSGSLDETIRKWNIDSGECLEKFHFNCSINCIETFNNGELLIIGTGSIISNDIIIYNINKKYEIKRYSAHSKYLTSLKLLSNGNLLTSCANGEIKLWNLLVPNSN
jgi:WD40 repeat protein